jgi:hypothetical protein
MLRNKLRLVVKPKQAGNVAFGSNILDIMLKLVSF